MRFYVSLSTKAMGLFIGLTIINIFFITYLFINSQVGLIKDKYKLNKEKRISQIYAALNTLHSNNKTGLAYQKKNSIERLAMIVDAIESFGERFVIVSDDHTILHRSHKDLMMDKFFIHNTLAMATRRHITGEIRPFLASEEKYSFIFFLPLDTYTFYKCGAIIPFDIRNNGRGMNGLYTQAVVLAFLIIIFHLVFAGLISGVIFRPIKVLNEKCREIAAGDYSCRVDSSHKDELGGLSASFNRMASIIESKIIRFNEKLEEVAEAKARIEEMAAVDELTKLFNRRFFFQRLQEEIERAVRQGNTLGFMMIDIDHFKKFNDMYGHQIGDMVLYHVSQIIKDSCRRVDVVGRYGGEELAVAAPDCPLDKIGELADRLRNNIEKTCLNTTDGDLCVTVSVGVTSFDELMFDSMDNVAKMLIFFADAALYEAKKNGRNCIAYG